MKLKIFLAYAIDEDEFRGSKVREKLSKIISDCGHEVIGAGIGSNPVIPTDSSKELCKVIARHDLIEQQGAHITITVTDGKTFCVGTPIEFFKGYELGQYSILYITNPEYKVNSIFFKAFADKIVYSEKELKKILIDWGDTYDTHKRNLH